MGGIHEYLQQLIDQGARSDPLVFAGRKAEIGKVLRALSNPPPEGPRGRTLLIEGAPGCGKTALMFELRRRIETCADAGIVFFETVPNEPDVEWTYGQLATMLVGADPPARGRTNRRDVRMGASLGVAKVDIASTRQESPTPYRSANRIAGEQASGWHPRQRTAVFVDEVQQVAPGGQAAEMLQDLHAQSKIPVLLICAGLGNSRVALARAGLSRLEDCVALGGLSAGETLDCAQRTLVKVAEQGIRTTDATLERWAEALARAADDWPRHLQVHLQAAWRTLLEQETPDLDTADLSAALDLGERRRAEYYEDRVAASGTPIEVIASLHERMAGGQGLRASDAPHLIGQAVDRLDARTRREWATRFDDSTEKCFAELLRAGVVSMDAMYRCTSPVPSFSRHILARA